MWKLQDNILEPEDKDFLVEFIRSSDRFTQFEKVKEFEREWSRWQGTPFSTFVNSGSSANLVMLDAVKEFYGIPDGAEVIVPAVTWTTNITSVLQAKMQPVFVDVNLDDLSFDYEKLEKAITSRTSIILITHLIGIPADIERISVVAKKHNLIILEDCCESHGAYFSGDRVGNFGVASTFSFYWGHHLTTIEGGTICTKNEDLNDLFILKRSHGLARELHPSKHQKLKDAHQDVEFSFLFLTHGYNVRNTELHAVIGIRQLTHLEEYIEIRNRNHKRFLEIVRPIKVLLYHIDHPGISSFCLPFIFKKKKDKDALREVLRKHEVESRPIISGNLLRQPCFARFGKFAEFPNAETVHLNGFYIGNNQFVSDERLSLLQNVLGEVFG